MCYLMEDTGTRHGRFLKSLFFCIPEGCGRGEYALDGGEFNCGVPGEFAEGAEGTRWVFLLSKRPACTAFFSKKQVSCYAVGV